MTQPKHLDSYTARQNLMTHRRYRYRGCAPDVDNPKVAAGNNEVSVTAWEAPDVDGGEAQADRVRREDAAIDVCVGCPVMVECLAYGASLNRAGKLAVPHGILGGMTALERHRAFVKTRHEVTAPAPDHRLRTEQKMAVLRALAVHSDPYEVASAARMDVRTAGWQRSAIVTLMGLPRSASRMELLTAAVERGLVDAGLVVADDGTVLACPSGVKTHTVEPNGQMLLWAVEFERLLARLPVAEEPAPAVRRVERRPSLRARFVDVPGQLDLLLAAMEADLADVVDVCSLFPATPLEAAA